MHLIVFYLSLNPCSNGILINVNVLRLGYQNEKS